MKYLSFFRMRFAVGLQYRIAALAGAVTQFAWGFMEIMIFKAFYRADASSFPMSFQAAVSYVWLQQAFLALLAAWMMDNEIFHTIVSGNVAY
ncbi:MAG: ABC transporter permease, partial [Lachnospiraceae bacterium]|nr:ABC transporter permease [Lachnospiraceae bacterium]